MSESCEIVESLVVATSECPATDVIMVEPVSAGGHSSVVAGVTPPVQQTSAEATTQVVVEAYTLMVGEADAESDVSPTLVVADLALSAARSSSSVRAIFQEMATSLASAEDEIAAADVPYLLLSAAQASSEVTPGTVALFEATGFGTARSETSLGLLEVLESGVEGVSSVTILRRVEESVVAAADGTDEVVSTSEPQTFMLLSTATGTSMTMLQQEMQLVIGAEAEASADVWYKDPNRVAWVMNTETTAASWYDNFDFESIAQTPEKVLAVGPDGLYELEGDTDSGEQIDAHVQSGFSDFGTPQTKRVDAMYFGYTSSGRVSVTAETYESGHPPFTYYLEQRLAEAPRNTRVQLGKGLRGRYWRMTFRNADGADFEVHDATVDIAISSRRV